MKSIVLQKKGTGKEPVYENYRCRLRKNRHGID